MKLNYGPIINLTARNPIDGNLYFLEDWFKVCNGNNLDVVRFDDIENLPEKPYDFRRVLKADIRFPGICYRDKEGVLRIIDGRHRLFRLKQLGAKEGMFFVLKHKHLFDLTNRPLTSDYRQASAAAQY